MESSLRYLKSTGLVGELSEPWRLENDLRPAAQQFLDVGALAIHAHSPSLSVEDAYSLYAGMLCDAVDINLNLGLIFGDVPRMILREEGDAHVQ